LGSNDGEVDDDAEDEVQAEQPSGDEDEEASDVEEDEIWKVGNVYSVFVQLLLSLHPYYPGYASINAQGRR
jgi:hypothetical protein